MKYTFETALVWLKRGYKVRHKNWEECYYIRKVGSEVRTCFINVYNEEEYAEYDVLNLNELLDKGWEMVG